MHSYSSSVATDYWEERANKVLSNFNFIYADEIDMYEICWRYGIRIMPLDEPFTKDFSLYIRYGKKAKAFFIKHTDTGENYKMIPIDIMDVGREKPQHLINRFKWLDNDRFIIVN